MSFQRLLTVEPDGKGAEAFFASVSEQSERTYIGSERYDFLVAEEDGQLAGVVAVRDRTHLFHLFVASRFQRAGLARELWNRARQRASAAGGTGSYTVNASLHAVTAYEHLGFVRAGQPLQAHGIAYLPMRMGAAGHGR